MPATTEAAILTEATDSMRELAKRCNAGTMLHSFITWTAMEFENWSEGEQEGTDTA
jgi:hypothetical protein